MATNYNNIKWGTNTPTVIAWKADASHTYYPGIVKWSNNIVFARAVDVDGSATKTGLSSIASSLSSFVVPSTVSRASGYFYGDQITATATYQAYWTGSTTATKSLTELFSLTTSTTPSKYYLRDLFTPSRAGTRSITVKGDSHVTVTGSYTKLDGSAATVSTKSTTAKTVSDAWQGGQIVTSTAVDTYYKLTSSSGIGTTAAGTANVSAEATSAQKVRKVTVKKVTSTHAAASSFVVSYYSNASTSVSKTAAGTYDSFSGKDVTWTVTAPAYCTAVSPSGTVAAANNENAITVDTGCTRNARAVSVQISNCAVIATYVNLSGTTTSRTVVGTPSQSIDDVWSGAALTASVVANTYYSLTSSSGTGTNAASESNLTISGSAARKIRKLRNDPTSPISVTATYVTSGGTTNSSNLAAGASVDIWCGAVATYYWAAAPQYAAHVDGTRSGTINADDTTTTYTLSPSLTGLTRTLTTQVTFNSSLVPSSLSNITLKLNGSACYGVGAFTNHTWSQTSSQTHTETIAQGSIYTIEAYGLPSTATYYCIDPDFTIGTIAKGTTAVTRTIPIVRKYREIMCTVLNEGSAYFNYDGYSGIEGDVDGDVALVSLTAPFVLPNYWAGNSDLGEIAVTTPHGYVLIATTSTISSSKPFSAIPSVTYNNTAYDARYYDYPEPGTSTYTINAVVMTGYRVTIPKPGLGRNNITYGVCAYSAWTGSQPGTINGTTASTSTTISIGVATGDLVVWYSTVKSYFTATGAGTAINNYGKVTYGNVGASTDGYSIPAPTATPMSRTVKVTIYAEATYAFSSAQLTGYNTTTTAATTVNVPVTSATTKTYYFWLGGAVTLTGVAKNSYWSINGTGSIAVGTPTTYTFYLSAILLPSDHYVNEDMEVEVIVYNPTNAAITVRPDWQSSYFYDGNGQVIDSQDVDCSPISASIAAGASQTFRFFSHDYIYEYDLELTATIGSRQVRCPAAGSWSD